MLGGKLPIGVALVIAALVVVAGGCGGSSSNGDSEGASASSSGTPKRTITVNLSEYKLTPATVNVTESGTYEFKAVNKGSTDHALEIEGNGIEEETETIGPGETATVTVELDQDGTYEIYCPVGNHKDQGMEGTLVVGSGGTSTTEEDSTTTEDDSSGSGYG
jgi:uncharacterized cupredoxin-like copper-binding protein